MDWKFNLNILKFDFIYFQGFNKLWNHINEFIIRVDKVNIVGLLLKGILWVKIYYMFETKLEKWKRRTSFWVCLQGTFECA